MKDRLSYKTSSAGHKCVCAPYQSSPCQKPILFRDHPCGQAKGGLSKKWSLMRGSLVWDMNAGRTKEVAFHEVVFHEVIFHEVVFHEVIFHEVVFHEVVSLKRYLCTVYISKQPHLQLNVSRINSPKYIVEVKNTHKKAGLPSL